MSLELASTPDACHSARRALESLRSHVGEHALEEMQLLVSELIANGVCHGGTRQNSDRIRLEIRVRAEAVRVEVTDFGPGFAPQSPRPPPAPGGGGWGLVLVEKLAARWGTAGSTVWFEVERAPG